MMNSVWEKKTFFLSFHQNIKQLFALVCETQKYSSVLQEIIDSTKLLKETKLRIHLAKVSNSTLILTFTHMSVLISAPQVCHCLYNRFWCMTCSLVMG